MGISQEQFERVFRKVQASWRLEDMDLSPEEGELLRRVCMEEITEEEYNYWLLNH